MSHVLVIQKTLGVGRFKFPASIRSLESESRLSMEQERRFIRIIQECGNERQSNWAYRKLFTQCRYLIHRLLSQFTRGLDPQAQEDAESEAKAVFVRVIRDFRFESSARLTSVVYIYVRSALQRIVRKSNQQRIAIAQMQRQETGYSLDPEQPEPFLFNQCHDLLDQLVGEQRRVVELRLTSDLSWEEIGKQLGKAGNAAAKQFQRGIAKLRTLFNSADACCELRRELLSERAQQLGKAAIAKLQETFFPSPAEPLASAGTHQPEDLSMKPSQVEPTRFQKSARPLKEPSQVEPTRFQKSARPLKEPSQVEPTNRFQKSARTLKQKFRFKRLVIYGWYVAGLTTALLLAGIKSANAQTCQGWLCGPLESLGENAIFQENPTATVLLGGIFLILQLFALVVISVPLLQAVSSGARREDYSGYIMATVAIFVILTFINYLAGWLFGSGATANPQQQQQGQDAGGGAIPGLPEA